MTLVVTSQNLILAHVLSQENYGLFTLSPSLYRGLSTYTLQATPWPETTFNPNSSMASYIKTADPVNRVVRRGEWDMGMVGDRYCKWGFTGGPNFELQVPSYGLPPMVPYTTVPGGFAFGAWDDVATPVTYGRYEVGGPGTPSADAYNDLYNNAAVGTVLELPPLNPVAAGAYLRRLYRVLRFQVIGSLADAPAVDGTVQSVQVKGTGFAGADSGLGTYISGNGSQGSFVPFSTSGRDLEAILDMNAAPYFDVMEESVQVRNTTDRLGLRSLQYGNYNASFSAATFAGWTEDVTWNVPGIVPPVDDPGSGTSGGYTGVSGNLKVAVRNRLVATPDGRGIFYDE